jgi:hypothetical protein
LVQVIEDQEIKQKEDRVSLLMIVDTNTDTKLK